MRVPAKMTLEEIQDCFRQIIDVVSFLDVGTRQNINMKGRRLQNCGRSELPDDYITRAELSDTDKRVKTLEDELLP